MKESFINIKKVYKRYGREYKSSLIKIFILEDGIISDSGTHKELFSTNQYYQQLCKIELFENDEKIA